MRKNIVAGNWKMNTTIEESRDLVSSLNEMVKEVPSDVNIIICPPSVFLYPILKLVNTRIKVFSQNIYHKEKGAFTGEISASMIKSMGIKGSILGHSERREYFNETENILKEKVDIAIRNDIEIIFCTGEKFEERKYGNYFGVIKTQLEKSLFHLEEKDWANIIIAYEPVWAIGTGETATKEQAQEIHNFIRNLIREKYNEKLAEDLPILYGGSCSVRNAKDLFSQKDIDGGLIGGESLIAKNFIEIGKSF